MATTRSATTKSAKTKSAKTKSAKAKSAKAKSAARSVALKKSTQRKKAAVSTSRTKAKPGKPRASAARRAAPKPARQKQRFVVSHHREDDFKADGLRAYAEYRDLGIAKGTHGLARAHVIRLIGPCDPKEVSKLHFHGFEFQMVYVLKGWVKTYLEGQGEILMQIGRASCRERV